MYRYIIEQHVGSGTVRWRLLSEDRYDVGDLYRLNHEVTRNQNGEEVCVVLKEVHGTIVERKSFGEGDTVDGATVVKVHEDTVEFDKDGRRWTLKRDERYFAEETR